MNYNCVKCKTGRKAGVLIAITCVIALILLALFAVLWDMLDIGDAVGTPQSVYCTGMQCEPIKHMILALPWNKIRTPLIVFQILTQYINITGLKIPLLYRDFLAWLDVINLDLSWLFSIGCVLKTDFYEKLLLNTLAPIVFGLFLCFTYSIVYLRHKHTVSKQKRRNSTFGTVTTPPTTTTATTASTTTISSSDRVLERAFAKHAMVFLTMTFLVCSKCSTTVLQTFACDQITKDASYLRADYSISCNTQKHVYYQIYSGIMILVYPIGIPVLYAVILWHQRALLNPKDTALVERRKRNYHLNKTRFLWEIYRPSVYYWECVECLRRLLLTGTMVFVYPGETAQPAIACLIAFVGIVCVLWYQPHDDHVDTQIYILGCIIVFLSMFLSLLVKVQAGVDQQFEGSQAYSALLISLSILMVVAAVCQLLTVARRTATAYKNNKQKRQVRHDEESAATANMSRSGRLVYRLKSKLSFRESSSFDDDEQVEVHDTEEQQQQEDNKVDDNTQNGMAPLSTVHCDTNILNNNNSYISTIFHASSGADMTQATGGVRGHQ
jgi:hypothetical protein